MSDHQELKGLAVVQDAPAGAVIAPTLREVLEPLLEMPQSERSFSCKALLKCLEQLEHVERALLHRRSPEEETLADMDTILLTWLSAYFQGVSGTQSIIHGDLLEAELTASGIVAPFVQPSETLDPSKQSTAPSAAARFGVPTTVDPEVVCTSVSELVRMAAAALISLYVYLNFKQGPEDLASDEVLLVYTTIAIHSCVNVQNAAELDRQMLALIDQDVQEHGLQSVWLQQQQQQQENTEALQPLQFGCAQIRWLMHYVRGLVMHHMGAVYHILGNRDKQAECYIAQQKDMQYMCKALPDHPLSYSLFARCAMNNQQMSIAAAFLDKGLAVADAAGHDAAVCMMSFQRAAALLLGGSGSSVDAAVVQQLLVQGEAARESLLSWFPAAWNAHAQDGEPDRTLVLQKLLPEFEKRKGHPLPVEGQVNSLQGLLYVTKSPNAIPPGALSQVEGVEGIEVVQ